MPTAVQKTSRRQKLYREIMATVPGSFAIEATPLEPIADPGTLSSIHHGKSLQGVDVLSRIHAMRSPFAVEVATNEHTSILFVSKPYSTI